ncbi:MAG TPA: MoxR family ATPase [Microthrixaceae bacterium]|nr:MoxR family ATPase [Microthrixaceae bacterium]
MDPSTTTDTPLPPALVRPATAPVDGTAVPTDVAGDRAVLEKLLFEMKKVIVGQDRAIERLLTCLLAGGHCLLESVPGLAKTLSAETLALSVGGTFSRIQFTPDLLPADVVGTRIYRASSESFDVELGPIFANFVLADEINRAPAKVQSALLEVMAEQQVTIGGKTHHLDSPFLVLATQNPIESEGVYPLPEAQRDRFLMKVVLGYPSPAEEVEIVQRMGTTPPVAEQVISLEQVVRLQKAVDEVYVDRRVMDYAVNLVLCTRTPENFGLAELRSFIELGASPRASIGLIRGGRALALLRGRSYLTPQDVFDVAPEILRHRLLLSYEALAQDVTVEHVMTRILSTVPAPRVTPSQTGGNIDPYQSTTTDAQAWGY